MKKSNNIKNKIKEARQKKILSVDEYIKGIQQGDRMILGKAITLIESTKKEHQLLAKQIIERCLSLRSKQSFRLGITGVPGVGKSTFIEALGMYLIQQGKKIAVLAIDPTSNTTQGSILGDKTRMQELSIHENAFIRPSPAGDALGGVARKTREVIILCEAAGYDTIFIETVGVGQSEIAVHSMTDFFLLLLLPGGGDELQGIKRGIVEMADLIAVNKSDTNPVLAKQAKQAYRNAIHLFPKKESDWTVKTILCSALKNEGIQELWKLILNYQSFTQENHYFLKNRKRQNSYWFKETIGEGLEQLFYQHPKIKKHFLELQKKVEEEKITPFAAANQLLNIFNSTLS